MLNKIKAFLLPFVKSLVLAHVADLTALVPMFSDAIVKQTNLTKAQADALAPVLVDVVETEITTLINKI